MKSSKRTYVPGNSGINCPFNRMHTDSRGVEIECRCDNCSYGMCCYAETACQVCTFPHCDYAIALENAMQHQTNKKGD